MKNTEFENQRYYRILPDPLNQLIADVEDLELFFKVKNESDVDIYLSFLQCELPSIEEKLENILDYLKTTPIKGRVKQSFFRYSKRLNELRFQFENELISHNSSRNIELENAFDFEVDNDYILDPNKLLDNYLEIEKEFKDFIKIEAITLRSKDDPLNHINKTQNSNNLHSEVFSNNGFELFDYLLNNYVKQVGKRGRFSEIADYYWKMYYNNPKFIHTRPEPFKKWFYNNYNQEDIGKIKTPNELKNTNRERFFSTALYWFNSLPK